MAHPPKFKLIINGDPDFSYNGPSLWSIFVEIVRHRLRHWRQGDGWVD